MSVGAISWLQSSLRLDVTGEWNRVLHLSVSGVGYTCSRKLFQPYAHLPFFSKLLNDEIKKDEDGSIVIDRDGPLFRHILNWIRSAGSVTVGQEAGPIPGPGKLMLPDSFDEWDLLLDEAQFFGLVDLETAIRNNEKYRTREWKRAVPHSVYLGWKERKENSGTGPANSSAPALHPEAVMAPSVLPLLHVREGGVLMYQDRTISSVYEAVHLLLSVYHLKVSHWETKAGTTPNVVEHNIFFVQ